MDYISDDNAAVLAMLEEAGRRPLTVELGRTLAREGTGLLYLGRVESQPGRENGYATGCYPLSPWEADRMTHAVARAFNTFQLAREALTAMLEARETGTFGADGAGGFRLATAALAAMEGRSDGRK